MILMYGAGRVGMAVRDLARFLQIPCDVVTDANPPASFDTYDLIIPTPWLPPTHHAFASGKMVSELDFAARYLPEGFQLHVVTGTDGKSTTAWMLYHALQAACESGSVFLSGNFEVPLSETVRTILEKNLTSGHIVVEVSSFMAWHVSRNIVLLDRLPKGKRELGFLADSAIFTNFEIDHLNWHPSLQDYLDAKMRIVRPASIVLMNTQIEHRAEMLSLQLEVPPGAIMLSNDGSTLITTDGDQLMLDVEVGRLSQTRFSGRHNAMNMLAVLALIIHLGLDPTQAFQALKTLVGLPHRLEVITNAGGITAIDDSKSTSAQSLVAALSSFPFDNRVLLLAGGQDKEDHFGHITSLLRGRVRRMALIGQMAKELKEIAAQVGVEAQIFTTLEEAAEWLYDTAKSGDTVLLSPGCASLDMFHSYLDRAERFKALVKKRHPH